MKLSYIDKTTIKILLLTSLALAAIPYWFLAGGTLLGFVIVRLIGHAINYPTAIAYHRWICHNSFEPSFVGRVVMSVSMVTSGWGDPLQQVIAHRLHHPYADTDLDPHHSKNKGFLRLWLARYTIHAGGVRIPRDYFRNAWAVFLHKHYWKLWFVANILVYLLFDFKTMLILFPVNFAYSWFLSSLMNYLTHYDPVTGQVGPRNLGTVLSWLTAGESIHANHHDNPNRWDFSGNGKTDPGRHLIRLISR
jgi:stearoyl-CoA desaturase (delta-9 desaturase)